MESVDHFRIFFWQKFAPLFVLPVLAGFLAISPATEGWGRTGWSILGGVVGFGIALYFADAWRTSDVQLDDAGMTLHIGRQKQSWPYEKLLKVKQIGNYRVRMCWDSGIPGTHMHISVDLFDSNGFVDALLDRYAESQGRWLPELPSQEDQEAEGSGEDAGNPAA